MRIRTATDLGAFIRAETKIEEFRAIDDPHKDIPQGETGEVCARGPQVITGYWNQPDETARAMVDGAFRTGDVGYLDADGFLFLVDRLKDLIICSGFNVYPRVIEEVLYRHPAVAEAAVIGVPDEYRGEAPKAFVPVPEVSTASPPRAVACSWMASSSRRACWS